MERNGSADTTGTIGRVGMNVLVFSKGISKGIMFLFEL